MDKENKLPERDYKFSLLSNSPCGNDLFEGKAQEKIALQISNVLEYVENVKIIGIDGG